VWCVDGGFCVAVGFSILTTTDAGGHWTAQPMPSLARSGDHLIAASCVSMTTCWALSQGAVMLKTTDGGHSWTRESLPSGFGLVFGLWCVAPDHCWAPAGGPQNVILHTTDGGATWGGSSLPRGNP